MVDYRRLYIRRGKYPPPKGESECPGLECSGVVETIGNNVSRSKVGDHVCVLLSGGGYAEKVVTPAGQVLSILFGISLKDVARFPEVAGTVWLHMIAHNQTPKPRQLYVFVTAGSKEKLNAYKELRACVWIKLMVCTSQRIHHN
ncbi:quinone oxidoreductase PIG3 [Tanacetum coccineum]